MLKNIVIAALAAGVLLRIPWFAGESMAVKIAIWMGLFVCLLFFCAFCEEKWAEREARVRKIREIIGRLRDMTPLSWGGPNGSGYRKKV